MNTTLSYLTGNRKWLVRDFVVWGDSGSIDAAIIATESGPLEGRVVFLYELAGGLAQVVEFSDLVDHRGNQLPESIVNAEIVLVPKNEMHSFIVGAVGPSSFRIAKSFGEPAMADLLIMEMN